MEMMAHNPEEAKKKNIKSSVAKEYVSANKGKMSYSHLPEKVDKFKKLKNKLRK